MINSFCKYFLHNCHVLGTVQCAIQIKNPKPSWCQKLNALCHVKDEFSILISYLSQNSTIFY